MELLTSLDPFQWVIIGLGCTLLFWPAISSLFKSSPKSVEGGSLTDLVAEWENLSASCHEQGLHDACKKLDEVFPLLLEANDKKHSKVDE
jgi:hypothetical protein